MPKNKDLVLSDSSVYTWFRLPNIILALSRLYERHHFSKDFSGDGDTSPP
jgi:hypothetical protein